MVLPISEEREETHADYALDHASFQLEQGKICVILGPSGFGKSTMLNMLGGT